MRNLVIRLLPIFTGLIVLISAIVLKSTQYVWVVPGFPEYGYTTTSFTEFALIPFILGLLGFIVTTMMNLPSQFSKNE